MITTCKHCGATFDGGVEIIGRPSARLEALLMKLGSHMNTAHREHAQVLQLQGVSYMGLVFLNNFKSTDEALNLERDRHRWEIHQATLNARFSNESLKEQCAELSKRLVDRISPSFVNPDNRDHLHYAEGLLTPMLLEAMISIRDVLEEPNRYAEAKAEQLVS